METTRLLKYYKKILKLSPINMKYIRSIPNLKIIKTINVKISELNNNCYTFESHEINNAISNIRMNFEYVDENYKIFVGGYIVYNINSKKDNYILQENYQIIPCVKYYDIQILLKIKQTSSNDCILFSYDILDYSNVYNNLDYKTQIKQLQNVVLCSENNIFINIRKTCYDNIISINTQVNFAYDIKKYKQFCVHNLLNIMNIWVKDKKTSENKYFLELVDNFWICNFEKVLFEVLFIFIEFKINSVNEYITFDYIYCNSISINNSMLWLNYSW